MISRSCSQSWVNGSIATVYYHASGYSYGSRWWSWSLHKAGLEETQSRLLSGYLWQMNRTSIQVAKLEGKGRGLVATRKVAAGDLLLQEIPLMVIDSEDREVGAIFNSLGLVLPQHLQVSSDVFKVEFEAVDEVTKSKVLELFDPVRDDLKLELFENISEVEAGIRKSQEESPENQELGELVRRMGELGAGIVR